MTDVNQNIADILERNRRVEAYKAWETSKTRRGFIMLITYITAVVFLHFIGNTEPFIHALVPTGGYLLSTLSLPQLRRWWLKTFIK